MRITSPTPRIDKNDDYLLATSMEPNYEILEIDVYADLQKPGQLALARKYGLDVPDDEKHITSNVLRQRLAVTKLAHKIAKENKQAEYFLKLILSNQKLDDQSANQFPELQKFSDLLQKTYDTPEGIDTNVYQNVETPPTHPHISPLIHIPRPILDHDYEDVDFTNQHKPSESPNTKHTTITSYDNATQTSQENKSFITMATELRPLVKSITYAGNDTESCTEFIEKFELAARINAWTPQTKIDLFQTHLSDLPYKWMQIYKSENENILDWDTIKSEFLKTFSQIAQIEDLQSILENRLQKEQETPTKYLFEITYLCKKIDRNMPS